MPPVACPICRHAIRPSEADLCDLCARLVCDRCLRNVDERFPEGLGPATVCTTCLGAGRGEKGKAAE